MTSNPGRRGPRGPATAGLLALLLAVGPAFAQQGQAPQAPATAPQTQQNQTAPAASSAAQRSLQLDTGIELGHQRETEEPPIADNAISLSLERAIEIALSNNLDVVVQRFARQTARLNVLQQLGLYDTRLQVRADAVDQQNPTLNPLELNQLDRRGLSIDLVQPTVNGGQVTIGAEGDRTLGAQRNPDTGEVSPFSSYGSGLTFSLDQPLLRNFGRANQEIDLLVAQTNSQISLQQFEEVVTNTIQGVVNAYWDLAEAYLQLQVAQESLQLATELHNRNKIEVEVGTRPPLDLVQSEAAIAEREEAIIQAQTNIGNAEDQLRLLLNLPTEGQYWALPIRTTTAPEVERISIDLDSALETAFRERTDLRGQGLAIERARLQAAFARNQALPQLDLSVGYNVAGVGTGINESFEQVTGIDFDGWNASLLFAVPLQNRTAKAARTIADLAVETAETQRELIESTITNEVRVAARNVESAAKTIEAARASRQFQERNLDAERKRYENGMSTSFQITQIQEDVTQARQREVTAIINYRRAVTQFYRATGQLLDEEGVELLDPEQELRRFQFSLFR